MKLDKNDKILVMFDQIEWPMVMTFAAFDETGALVILKRQSASPGDFMLACEQAGIDPSTVEERNYEFVCSDNECEIPDYVITVRNGDLLHPLSGKEIPLDYYDIQTSDGKHKSLAWSLSNAILSVENEMTTTHGVICKNGLPILKFSTSRNNLSNFQKIR